MPLSVAEGSDSYSQGYNLWSEHYDRDEWVIRERDIAFRIAELYNVNDEGCGPFEVIDIAIESCDCGGTMYGWDAIIHSNCSLIADLLCWNNGPMKTNPINLGSGIPSIIERYYARLNEHLLFDLRSDAEMFVAELIEADRDKKLAAWDIEYLHAAPICAITSAN